MARPTRVIGRRPNKKRPPSGARLRLGHADAAERRIDVERVAQNAVAHAPPLAVQEIRGDDLEVVIGRVGEGAAAIAVAKRPDTGRAGAQFVIDGDIAAWVDVNTGHVKA